MYVQCKYIFFNNCFLREFFVSKTLATKFPTISETLVEKKNAEGGNSNGIQNFLCVLFFDIIISSI